MRTHLCTHALSNAVSYDRITKTLMVLQRKLSEVTHQWWQLGLHLKEHPAPLDDFKSHAEKDPVQEKFRRMLQYWLDEGEDEFRTWGALAKAVDDSNNRALGNKIRKLEVYRKDPNSKGIYNY